MICCAGLVLLSGCVTDSQNIYVPPPLTDQQIAAFSNDGLCEVGQHIVDPRLDAEVARRKINCDPAFRYCQEKHTAKAKMESCVENRRTWLTKMQNPAYAFCANSGFKDGSDAMATCLASERQRLIEQAAMNQQQAQFQQQQQQARWQAVQTQLQRQQEQQQRNYEIQMESIRANQYHAPTTTNCTNTGYGQINCTTY
jgi:hypothetical protein